VVTWIPLVIQVGVIVVRGTIGLLTPYVIRVGVEIELFLRTCTHNARVKQVRAPIAAGYLTVYRVTAVCVGTQGKCRCPLLNNGGSFTIRHCSPLPDVCHIGALSRKKFSAIPPDGLETPYLPASLNTDTLRKVLL